MLCMTNLAASHVNIIFKGVGLPNIVNMFMKNLIVNTQGLSEFRMQKNFHEETPRVPTNYTLKILLLLWTYTRELLA
jgi:hypothetical protein